MDPGTGFVADCAAIADSNNGADSRSGTLPPVRRMFQTAPQHDLGGTDKPLEARKTVTDHPPVRPRFALHRKNAASILQLCRMNDRGTRLEPWFGGCHILENKQ